MGDLVKYIRGLEADTIAALNRERAFLVTRAASPDAVLFEPRSEGEALWRIVRANALKAAGAGATQEYAKLGVGLAFNTLNPRVQDYLNEKELVIKTIPKAWHDRLRAELLAGNKAGEPVTEITKRVQSVYGDMQTWQARRIAQTETVGAYNNGTYSAMVTAEVGKKKWIATLDDKVRDSHARMHGKVVGVKETFPNGLLHPGDPRGRASEVIGCRCSIGSVVEKGAERPVPAVPVKPAGLPKFNAGGKWDAAEMQKEEARLAKLLDQANTAEAAGETKARIAKALAGRLKDSEPWLDAVCDEVVGTTAAEARVAWAREGLAEAQIEKRLAVFSKQRADEIIMQWAGTSGDTNKFAIAMQLAAKDEFALDAAALGHFSEKALGEATEYYKANAAGLRAFLRAQYDETQEWLAKEGIEDVLVYRGAGLTATETAAVKAADGVGLVEVGTQPMSSFSSSIETAREFGAVPDGGVVFSSRVPRERIMGSCQTGYGCKKEAEIVVLGGSDEVRLCRVRDWANRRLHLDELKEQLLLADQAIP